MKLKIIGLALTVSLVFFAIVTCMVLLLSCNSEKKLTAKAETFMSKYPKKALPVFRDKYPCILTKADTTIFLSDTTFLVDCPDTIPAAEYFTLHDTTVKNVYYPGKTIKVPVTLPQKVVTIVKTIEDLSRIAEMDIKLKEANKKADELTAKNKDKGKVIIWLIVFLVGLLTPYVIKAVKFFTI